MKQQKGLLFSVILFFLCLQGVMGWELVYENDESGNCIYGDLDLLITAIEQGAEVRLTFYSKDEYGNILFSYTQTAEKIVLDNGMVYGYLKIQGSARSGNNYYIHPSLTEVHAIIDTNGYLDRCFWSLKYNEERRRDRIQVAVKWFIDG